MSVYVHQFHVCSEAGFVVIHCTLATSKCCLEKKKRGNEMKWDANNITSRYSYF